MYGLLGFGLLPKLIAGGAIVVVFLSLMAWILHSIESGAAAKVELENVRKIAQHNTQKANELAEAYDKKSEAESAARQAVANAQNRIKNLTNEINAVPKTDSSECPIDCKIPIQVE